MNQSLVTYNNNKKQSQITALFCLIVAAHFLEYSSYLLALTMPLYLTTHHGLITPIAMMILLGLSIAYGGYQTLQIYPKIRERSDYTATLQHSWRDIPQFLKTHFNSTNLKYFLIGTAATWLLLSSGSIVCGMPLIGNNFKSLLTSSLLLGALFVAIKQCEASPTTEDSFYTQYSEKAKTANSDHLRNPTPLGATYWISLTYKVLEHIDYPLIITTPVFFLLGNNFTGYLAALTLIISTAVVYSLFHIHNTEKDELIFIFTEAASLSPNKEQTRGLSANSQTEHSAKRVERISLQEMSQHFICGAACGFSLIMTFYMAGSISPVGAALDVALCFSLLMGGISSFVNYAIETRKQAIKAHYDQENPSDPTHSPEPAITNATRSISLESSPSLVGKVSQNPLQGQDRTSSPVIIDAAEYVTLSI